MFIRWPVEENDIYLQVYKIHPTSRKETHSSLHPAGIRREYRNVIHSLAIHLHSTWVSQCYPLSLDTPPFDVSIAMLSTLSRYTSIRREYRNVIHSLAIHLHSTWVSQCYPLSLDTPPFDVSIAMLSTLSRYTSIRREYRNVIHSLATPPFQSQYLLNCYLTILNSHVRRYQIQYRYYFLLNFTRHCPAHIGHDTQIEKVLVWANRELVIGWRATISVADNATRVPRYEVT